MRDRYKRQVALLIRILPSVYGIKEFAIHGGTAINLFHKNMPRYSVDVDITYTPLQDRETSLSTINQRLLTLKGSIERSTPGIAVIHKPDVWKLLCTHDAATVKIEVNGTKRGIIGDTVDMPLCDKARQEFSMGCKARTVSFSQLYGGKVVAALSRQHPRDLFDCKYMDVKSFTDIKDGFMLCLLGSDRPIIETLRPNVIDQATALENQFSGMTDIPFSYSAYTSVRNYLINWVNENLDDRDKEFLLSFESGTPDWSKCSAGDLSAYPSVQWKLLNIGRLKKNNLKKHEEGIAKLKAHLKI